MSINKTTNELDIDEALNETTDELNIDEALNETTDESNMDDLNVDKVFTDDFEIRYEGEFPDLPKPKDDNYKDVLASLSELDNTRKIDYLEENYTASFDLDTPQIPEVTSDTEKSTNSHADTVKAAIIILILAVTGILFALLGKYL